MGKDKYWALKFVPEKILEAVDEETDRIVPRIDHGPREVEALRNGIYSALAETVFEWTGRIPGVPNSKFFETLVKKFEEEDFERPLEPELEGILDSVYLLLTKNQQSKWKKVDGRYQTREDLLWQEIRQKERDRNSLLGRKVLSPADF